MLPFVCCLWLWEGGEHLPEASMEAVLGEIGRRPGMPLGVAVPTASPGIRSSLSSQRVMAATTPSCTPSCGTIVALDGSDP